MNYSDWLSWREQVCERNAGALLGGSVNRFNKSSKTLILDNMKYCYGHMIVGLNHNLKRHTLWLLDVVLNSPYEKEWHEKTVKTLLNPRVKKNALAYEKEQRRYLYSPLIEREKYMEKESNRLIERMFSGRVSPLVAGFAKHNQLNKDDVAELKAIISQWEKNND